MEENILNIKPREQKDGVKMEYTYKGHVGQILSTGTMDRLELAPVPPGVAEFDGYIETPYGNFAYQGPIKGIENLINQIKKFCFEVPGLKKELLLIEEKIVEMQRKERNFNPNGAQSNYEDWVHARNVLKEFSDKRKNISDYISSIEQAVSVYKI